MGKGLGNEGRVWVGVGVVVFGIVIGWFGRMRLLMIGRGVVGVGIGICNVVLGGVVKHKFRGDGGLMRSV